MGLPAVGFASNVVAHIVLLDHLLDLALARLLEEALDLPVQGSGHPRPQLFVVTWGSVTTPGGKGAVVGLPKKRDPVCRRALGLLLLDLVENPRFF